MDQGRLKQRPAGDQLEPAKKKISPYFSIISFVLILFPQNPNPRQILFAASLARQARKNEANYCLLSYFPLNYEAMDKAEIKAIGDFLSDVYEGICEGDETTTMQQQLTELYRVIKRLMDLTFKAPEREKQFFAMLEYNARQYKNIIKARLAVRN